MGSKASEGKTIPPGLESAIVGYNQKSYGGFYWLITFICGCTALLLVLQISLDLHALIPYFIFVNIFILINRRLFYVQFRFETKSRSKNGR